jgi:MFS family permease
MSEPSTTADRPRTSFPAVLSLIAGLLGWFVLPAIVAILAGIIGLKHTRNPNVRGRGLAIAGLILGTIFGLVGTGAVVMVYRSYAWGMQQVTTRLPIVINAVSASDTTSAQEYNAMSPAAMATLKEKTAGWGKVSALSDLELSGDRISDHPDRLKVTGVATFDAAGNKPFDVVISAQGDEVRIVDVVFRE